MIYFLFVFLLRRNLC